MPDPDVRSSIPVLSRKKVMKQRKRYWRWRLPTALIRATSHTPECTEDPNFPDFGIALIALGGKFHRWSRILIQSLRDTGTYHGPVYVVTEKPEAFAGLDNVAPVKVARTRHQMVAKTCKTFLFDWVPCRRILYVDADIVCGEPIQRWFDDAIALQENTPTLFYPDPGDRNLPLHGGLILMDRARSAPLFRQWRQQLASGRFRQDQEALLTIADDHAIGHFPDGGILFPDEPAIDQQRRACFVHITRHRYRMLGHDRLHYYLEDVLGIAQADERLDFS
ncbi:hypothetical protein [Salinisphaera aquimarina]|uniref:Glycosyl transferase n=1 Tax=Salinisphaera aquimarina TaxID=2094031 RepID=A0ABV7EM86_9GAMM